MNQTRLLRLSKQDRVTYIREELGRMRINELKSLCKAYGVNDTRGMSKPELIDVLVLGLCEWAEETLNAIYV